MVKKESCALKTEGRWTQGRETKARLRWVNPRRASDGDGCPAFLGSHRGLGKTWFHQAMQDGRPGGVIVALHPAVLRGNHVACHPVLEGVGQLVEDGPGTVWIGHGQQASSQTSEAHARARGRLEVHEAVMQPNPGPARAGAHGQPVARGPNQTLEIHGIAGRRPPDHRASMIERD